MSQLLNVSLTHFFGIATHYGSGPEDVPGGWPLEGDFERGSQVEVFCGCQPAQVLEQERRARADFGVFLRRVANGELIDDSSIRSACRVARDEEPGISFDWSPVGFWLSVRATKSLELPDDWIAFDRECVWLNHAEALRSSAADASELAETVEMVAALLCARIGEVPGYCRRGPLIYSAVGREPQLLTKVEGGNLVAYTNPPPDAFPLHDVELVLSHLPASSSRRDRMIAHWFTALVGETDPLRSFTWALAGIEQIINSVANRGAIESLASRMRLMSGDILDISDVSVELMWPDSGERFPERSAKFKFLITALTLSPVDASRDYAMFAKAWDVRSKLSHGALTSRETPDPSEARRLFLKYAALYLGSDGG